MNSCRAKVKKIVPGMLWGNKKVSENCEKEAKNTGKYCEKHGCVYCSYQIKGEKISAVDGSSLVCKNCLDKDIEKAFQNNKELKELEFEDRRTRTLLHGLNKKFLEEISKILDKLNNGKRKIISKNTGHSATITDDEINNFFLKTIEDYQSVLTTEEIKSWKESYRGKGGDLDQITSSEEEFLLKLAKERKKNYEEEVKQKKEKKLQIIQDIEKELSNSLPVNIVELDNKFHDYKNLVTSELEKTSNDLIEAIKNKRTEKQLIDLIKRGINCSDGDLWSFIQELEKFSLLSLYQKNAYLTHQNEADTTLTKLRERWDNLDEEKKLTNYWNKAIRNFENWLKEADNLQLTADEPFQDFKGEIKKCKTKEIIEDQEKQVYQHILIKFKVAVKQSLGAEKKTKEYQDIDKSKTLEEVKLARDKIRQIRQSPSPKLPQTPQNSNESASQTIIRVTVAIGGSLIILAVIGIIAKKKKILKQPPKSTFWLSKPN